MHLIKGYRPRKLMTEFLGKCWNCDQTRATKRNYGSGRPNSANGYTSTVQAGDQLP